MEIRINQLDAKFSCSRGESLPVDIPIRFPIQMEEDVILLNTYLNNNENRKALVRELIFIILQTACEYF
jgi:hypothetical protein